MAVTRNFATFARAATSGTRAHNRRRALIVRRHQLLLDREQVTCRCGAGAGEAHDERCSHWSAT